MEAKCIPPKGHCPSQKLHSTASAPQVQVHLTLPIIPPDAQSQTNNQQLMNATHKIHLWVLRDRVRDRERDNWFPFLEQIELKERDCTSPVMAGSEQLQAIRYRRGHLELLDQVRLFGKFCNFFGIFWGGIFFLWFCGFWVYDGFVEFWVFGVWVEEFGSDW